MTFTKYLRANREGPLYILAWQGGFLALGLAMTLVGIRLTAGNEESYACLGSLYVLVATVAGVMVRGQTSGAGRFDLVMSMGLTRREYLLYDPMVTALIGAMGLAISWIVYHLETWWHHCFYPDAVSAMDIYVIFRLKYILLFLLGLVLMDLVFTALTLRFGFNAFRAVWIALCLSCVVIPNSVSAYQEGGGSLFAKLGWLLLTVARLLTPTMWLAVGIAALLAVLAASVRVLQKAEVKL